MAVTGGDYNFPFFTDKREIREFVRRPTLGELLKRVEDAQSPDNRVVEEPPMLCPFKLSFRNLSYSVKVRRRIWPAAEGTNGGRVKLLLNDISGEAREGEIMAVLGASGSGKSTLIDALADRIAKGRLKGTVKLNHEVVESSVQKAISAYIMQDDLLFPMLTVEESLMFSAEFRLPQSLSKSKKKARVQALIHQLGLTSAATTIIGDESRRGVSGGERRRVSIGMDIIHDPILLFLDEPTSGLDSTSAFMVVKILQRIARSGSVVITSIHQPSYRILNLLDRLIFLSQGEMVYAGSPMDLPDFLAEFGHPIPENENRTEFALDLIRDLEETIEGTRSMVEHNKSWQRKIKKNQLGNYKTSYDSSNEIHLSLKDAISASISRGKLVSDTNRSSSFSKFSNPIWIEILVIAKRSITNSRRKPELFGVRLGAILITGAILATVFWHLDNSPKGIQERLGFFAFAMSTIFYTCAEAIPVFLQERNIFMRETAYNAYRRSSYVIAHSLISIPSLIFLSLVFTGTTFFAVGLAGDFSGFLFFFSTVLAGSSFVTFLSSVVFQVMLGYTVVVAILAYFFLFSGFFLGRDRIPPYWIWFHYISLVKYPYEAVMRNEFEAATECFVRGVQIFDMSPLAAVPATAKVELLTRMGKELGLNLTGTTCVATGSDVLRQRGVTDLSKWNCIWISVASGFFFRILFYFALLLGTKNKRK